MNEEYEILKNISFERIEKLSPDFLSKLSENS